MPEPIPQEELNALARDKYNGDASNITESDRERLSAGEPLAYVIGNIPFLGLTIALDTRPLIPRPETEWWTEELIRRIGEEHVSVLDLCAGSGAIGLALLAHCPNARVSFGELVPEHAELIRRNIAENNLDASRAAIHTGDLFAPFANARFDVIATNPPYIPQSRELPHSVSLYEPESALRGGPDGLSVIRRILRDASAHVKDGGELWMEVDVENMQEAEKLAQHSGTQQTHIRNDQYGRPRLLVGYY